MRGRIGVDVGGTKIEVVVLDPDGEEVLRRRLPTPQGDYEGTLAAVATLVEEASAVADPHDVVGIGTPGVVSAETGLMKNANSVVLNGRPLATDLEAALERPVILHNDADCLALSEAIDGAAAGADTVFAAILGTGVGGGLAVRGRVGTGPNRIRGEWGHVPLPWATEAEWPGRDCYCGRRGCIETWLSGPGFEADHRRASGVDATAPDIVAAVAGGNEAAAALARYVDRLARSLAMVIDILDPDVIVLGGGMSNVDEIYRRVPPLWPRYVFGGESATRLVRNAHGDSSGVRGAAMLVPA